MSRISKPMKGRVYTELFHRLRSERDKSVYFWLWGGNLLYNAIITRKKKQKLTLFSFCATGSPVRHLVYLVKRRSDSYADKSYKISFLSIYFPCKTELKSYFCLFTWHCFIMAPDASLYLVSSDVLYFCRANKRHMYATPLSRWYTIIFLYNFLRYNKKWPRKKQNENERLIHDTII